MNNNFITKKADNALNLKPVLEMVWEVFLDFEAKEYSAEGINEFKRYIELSNINSLIKNNEMKMWITYDKDTPIGVIATRPDNHISLLFVDKKYHKQGIAKNLFNNMLNNLDKKAYSEMTVNSSLYANDIYKKFGFKNTEKAKEVNGIIFIPMKMKI